MDNDLGGWQGFSEDTREVKSSHPAEGSERSGVDRGTACAKGLEGLGLRDTLEAGSAM